MSISENEPDRGQDVPSGTDAVSSGTETAAPQESQPFADFASENGTSEQLQPRTESGDLFSEFAQREVTDCIMECRSLSKNYSNFAALTNVNLKVPAGGVVGLLGPNGSGKTTLIKLAMGMLQPTAGEILVHGRKPGAATKAVTAYLPDANYLCKWMRVDQQIAYYADFFPDFNRQKAEQLLTRLGIGLKQKIKALSKGNQEKLGLLLTMSRDAKLYILDEPIAGVDPAARDFILETIMSNKPANSTIFLCTHLIADIEPILTHAIFLKNGTIALNAPVDEVRAKEGKSLDELFREVFKW